MRGTVKKKIQRSLNKKVRTDLNVLAEKVSEERFSIRLIFAFRIIFKINPKVKYVVKNKLGAV